MGRAIVPTVIVALALVGAMVVTGIVSLRRAAPAAPTVGPEVPATAMDMLQMPSYNSPAVSADPTDPRFIVLANRVDAPAFDCALQISGDGARTWAGAAPVPALPPGADTCYGPEVAFEPDGDLHYLFIGLQGPGNAPTGVFLTTSRDQGRTFSLPRQVLGPRNFGVRMAIDQSSGPHGRMHLVWLHATSDPPIGGFLAEPNPILSAHSDDGGLTFSAPVQVSDQARDRVVAPGLAIGPGKTVHVGYYDLGEDARDYQGLAGPVWEGTWSVVVATSVDGGLRFGPGAVVDGEVTPPDRPILIFTMAPPALAADEDATCAAWTDARHGDADVLLRCSRDRAASWGEIRRLNDDTPGNGYRQYLPKLSFAPGGRLDAIFLDRRHHPNNDRIDVSYTFSRNEGWTFNPNVRVTTNHSSSSIGAQYEGPSAEGQHEIGSRLGLLSTRSAALLAWPDSRNSLLPGTAHDIFAATVRHHDPGQPTWARASGGLLLVGAILALPLIARRRRPGGGPGQGHENPQVSGQPEQALRRPRWLVGVPLLAVFVAAGVLGLVAIAPDRQALLPGPDVVAVTMTDNRFKYARPIRSGRVVFRVRNAGNDEHRIAVYPLPEDLPPIDVQLQGSERRNVERLAAPLPRKPGETQSFAVNLEPGRRYALLCFLKPPRSQNTYAQLGMTAEFRPFP